MIPATENTISTMPSATGPISHQSTWRSAPRQSERSANALGTSVRCLAEAMARG